MKSIISTIVVWVKPGIYNTFIQILKEKLRDTVTNNAHEQVLTEGLLSERQLEDFRSDEESDRIIDIIIDNPDVKQALFEINQK